MATDLPISGPIVCGVDDSDGAGAAVRVAAWLCGELDSQLALLHVASPPANPGLASAGYAYAGARDYEAAIEAGRTLLERTVAELHFDEVVATQVVIGDPAERLREFGADEGASLLAVGSRGRGPLRSALLGSVSGALAANAPCPVVVMPPNLASAEQGPARQEPAREPGARSAR